MAGYRGGGGGAASGFDLTWGFAGTVSTDQNNNLERYRFRAPAQFASFDVNVVAAGVGGDTVVLFKKYDFALDAVSTIATVTLAAGDRRSVPELATVAFAVDDEIWPEVQNVSPTTPPVTMTMTARS